MLYEIQSIKLKLKNNKKHSERRTHVTVTKLNIVYFSFLLQALFGHQIDVPVLLKWCRPILRFAFFSEYCFPNNLFVMNTVKLKLNFNFTVLFWVVYFFSCTLKSLSFFIVFNDAKQSSVFNRSQMPVLNCLTWGAFRLVKNPRNFSLEENVK